MKKSKKPQKEDPGYWVHCLRCDRTSRVQLVANFARGGVLRAVVDATNVSIIPCVVREDVRMSDAAKEAAARNGITVVESAELVRIDAPPTEAALDDAVAELRRCEAAAMAFR